MQNDPYSSSSSSSSRSNLATTLFASFVDPNGTTRRRTGTVTQQQQRRRAATVTTPPRVFQWRQPPRQLCFWGEPAQNLHTNWFDLFFDLIFVAAMLQLGTLLKYNLDFEGVVYFVIIFFSIMQAWSNKVQYDARVAVSDLAHKVLDVVETIAVAGAALHISGTGGSGGGTPLQTMNDLASSHAWGFSLLMMSSRAITCLRWVEVFVEKETPGSHATARTLAKQKGVATVLYGLATVFSNSNWWGDVVGADTAQGTDDYADSSYSSSSYSSSYSSLSHSSNSSAHVEWRRLADASSSSYSSSTSSSSSSSSSSSKFGSARHALLLWFIANLVESYLVWFVLLMIKKFQQFKDGGKRKKKMLDKNFRMPLHVGFTIHRMGEWTMLLIGESILSLIVGVELSPTPRFYAIFVGGFIAATCLQFVFYSTQPFTPSLHAMRRSAFSGLLWTIAHQAYSCVLVAFGVSLKVLLSESETAELASDYAFLHCASLAIAVILVQVMHVQHMGFSRWLSEIGLSGGAHPDFAAHDAESPKSSEATTSSASSSESSSSSSSSSPPPSPSAAGYIPRRRQRRARRRGALWASQHDEISQARRRTLALLKALSVAVLLCLPLIPRLSCWALSVLTMLLAVATAALEAAGHLAAPKVTGDGGHDGHGADHTGGTHGHHDDNHHHQQQQRGGGERRMTRDARSPSKFESENPLSAAPNNPLELEDVAALEMEDGDKLRYIDEVESDVDDEDFVDEYGHDDDYDFYGEGEGNADEETTASPRRQNSTLETRLDQQSSRSSRKQKRTTHAIWQHMTRTSSSVQSAAVI